MKKFLLLLSVTCLCLLSLGTFLKLENVIFWLASDAAPYQYIRLFLALILVSLLFTAPPRHLWFRLFIGTVALTISAWAIQSSFSYSMQLVDTLCFLSASLAIAAGTFEPRTETKRKIYKTASA